MRAGEEVGDAARDGGAVDRLTRGHGEYRTEDLGLLGALEQIPAGPDPPYAALALLIILAAVGLAFAG